MLELFLTFIILSFLFFFSFLYNANIAKFIILICEIITGIILFTNYGFKKHKIWKSYENVYINKFPHELINDFEDDGKVMTIGRYSIKSIKNYDKKCAEKIFVPINESCPITQILIDDNDNYEDFSGKIYVMKYNKFLLYNRDNKTDTFYYYNGSYSDDLDINNINKFNLDINYTEIDLNSNKTLNIVKKLKEYDKYTNLIIFSLLIFYLFYLLIEIWCDLIFYGFKPVNLLIQIIILSLYIIRYIKYKQLKMLFMKKYI